MSKATITPVSEADLAAHDFEPESCMWDLPPGCNHSATWSASCDGCSEFLGLVCQHHLEVYVSDEEEVFCRFCELAGLARDITRFVPVK